MIAEIGLDMGRGGEFLLAISSLTAMLSGSDHCAGQHGVSDLWNRAVWPQTHVVGHGRQKCVSRCRKEGDWRDSHETSHSRSPGSGSAQLPHSGHSLGRLSSDKVLNLV